MKNSKRFSVTNWQHDSFLSAQQLNSYCETFHGEANELALSVIDLTLLSSALIDNGPALTTYFLDKKEQDRLASFTFAKRYLEWLGGRIAVKKAVMDLLGKTPQQQPCYRDLRIESDGSGRPYLVPVGEPPAIIPEISITHSGNYAGGLAVKGRPCGLDLQKISPRIINIRERFASSPELEMICDQLHLHNEATSLCLLWSAKESFRKAFACQPLIGFTELTLKSLTGDLVGGVVGHFSCPRVTSSLLPALLTIKGDLSCAITVVF